MDVFHLGSMRANSTTIVFLSTTRFLIEDSLIDSLIFDTRFFFALFHRVGSKNMTPFFTNGRCQNRSIILASLGGRHSNLKMIGSFLICGISLER
jgi:hypothetical protein